MSAASAKATESNSPLERACVPAAITRPEGFALIDRCLERALQWTSDHIVLYGLFALTVMVGLVVLL